MQINPTDLKRFCGVPAERSAEVQEIIQIATRTSDDVFVNVLCGLSADHIRQSFLKRYNVKRSGGRNCIRRLYGKQCVLRDCCRPPGDDHGALYSASGKPAIYLSQPYGLDQKTLREMMAFAEAHELEFDIDSLYSFHFPTHTVAVVWYSKHRDLNELAAAARPTREG